MGTVLKVFNTRWIRRTILKVLNTRCVMGTILKVFNTVSRRVYKERLGVPQKVIIGYQSHADTATKSGSSMKNKFVA
jgi:hypothetical protein